MKLILGMVRHDKMDDVRSALEKVNVRAVTPPASKPHLDAAVAALARFMDLNAQIIALSRRNTNVRSLALSLDQKREIVVKCEDTLRTLRTALEKREYAGRR